MATISFKTDEEFKRKLEAIAKRKGVNTSSYIKLILTEGVNGDLISITENGLTLQEELQILNSDENDKISGPYKTAKSLIKGLKS